MPADDQDYVDIFTSSHRANQDRAHDVYAKRVDLYRELMTRAPEVITTAQVKEAMEKLMSSQGVPGPTMGSPQNINYGRFTADGITLQVVSQIIEEQTKHGTQQRARVCLVANPRIFGEVTMGNDESVSAAIPRAIEKLAERVEQVLAPIYADFCAICGSQEITFNSRKGWYCEGCGAGEDSPRGQNRAVTVEKSLNGPTVMTDCQGVRWVREQDTHWTTMPAATIDDHEAFSPGLGD